MCSSQRSRGDTIHLGPDKRDSIVPWFYWYFRVTGAPNRALTFVFDEANVGVRGPAVSVDAGKTWKWLGADAVKNGTFSFPPKAKDVRFSVGMPYLQSDLKRCLQRHRGNRFLHI